MCLGCFPYHGYVIEDPPKPKEKKPKTDWYLVEPGDVFYPVTVSTLVISDFCLGLWL